MVLEEVLDEVVVEIRELLVFDQLSLRLINQEDFSLTWDSVQCHITENEFNRLLKETAEAQIIQPNRDSSFSDESAFLKGCWNKGARSFLFCPIISKETVLGGLLLYSFNENAYSEEEKELLQDIAGQLVSPILHSQIEQMTQT